MGYDVTFHPVSRGELQHYLFDVVNSPSLAEERARSISSDGEMQERMVAVYQQLSEWDPAEVPFNASFGVAAAILAGMLHPYWYARGQCVSFLAREVPGIHELITPLPRTAMGAFGRLNDPSDGLITENYTASGLVERLDDLSRRFRQEMQPRRTLLVFKRPGPVMRQFDEQGVEALERALAYAAERRLGLMEATDVHVPLGQEFQTNPAHLRAHYLGRLDP